MKLRKLLQLDFLPRGTVFPRCHDARKGTGKMKPGDRQTPSRPLDARVRIGHVPLKVADLERAALAFYRDALGFEL